MVYVEYTAAGLVTFSALFFVWVFHLGYSYLRICYCLVGFAFEEIGCLRSSKSKVLSCHFSSDGRLLASAGHDKKVL